MNILICIIFILYILDIIVSIIKIRKPNIKYTLSIKLNTILGIMSISGLFYLLSIDYLDTATGMIVSLLSGTVIGLIDRFFIVKQIKQYKN